MKRAELKTIHTELTDKFSLEDVLGERNLDFWRKSEGEYVTSLDLQIDDYLQKMLKKVLDVPILSEEREIPSSLPSIYWLIDPVDGTQNLIAGLSPTAVSIALLVDGLPVVALISRLEDGCVRSAYKGANDWRDNPAPAALSQSQPLIGLSTGIIRESTEDPLWGKFVKLLTQLGRTRIFGSQAMQGLWVAESKLQMSFSYESRAWDDAAAGLLVNESGGGWFCLTELTKVGISPHYRTSSTFVSADFKKHASSALALFETAITRNEKRVYRSMGLE